MGNLTELPTEILIDIFLYLDYYELKFTLPSTHRRLHKVVKGIRNEPALVDFAQRLFIDQLRHVTVDYCFEASYTEIIDYPLSGYQSDRHIPISPGVITLNPSLQHLKIRQPNRCVPKDGPILMNDIGLITDSGIFVALLDSPTALENSTSPAVIYIHLTLWEPFKRYDSRRNNRDNRNDILKPLTVGDLVQRILDMANEYFVVRSSKTQHMSDPSSYDGFGDIDGGLDDWVFTLDVRAPMVPPTSIHSSLHIPKKWKELSDIRFKGRTLFYVLNLETLLMKGKDCEGMLGGFLDVWLNLDNCHP